MNNIRILADTSVWIEYFRQSAEVVDIMEKGFDNNTIFIAGPVITELFLGIKSEKEKNLLKSCISVIPFLGIEKEDWEIAGEIACDLRKKGITLPLVDIVLYTLAKNYDLLIFTYDTHFNYFDDPNHVKVF